MPGVPVEGNGRCQSEFHHALLQSAPIGLSLAAQDFRVGLASNQVTRRPTGPGELRHRLDAPLNSLARSKKTPAEDQGASAPERGHMAYPTDRRTVRNDGHLRHIEGVSVNQPVPCS